MLPGASSGQVSGCRPLAQGVLGEGAGPGRNQQAKLVDTREDSGLRLECHGAWVVKAASTL